MKDFINSYKQKGLIKEEKIGFDQVVKHLERANKDLIVSKKNFEIDTEASYNYAYLAMLRAGRALMFSLKFRPIDGEQHKTVVAFCEYILGSKHANVIKYFDRMRKKRNRFTYDEPGIVVSDTETEKALKNSREFVKEVHNFIQKKNPQVKLI